MITFTPLSGDAHTSDGSPLAYLLQVDDVKILLDCGSPEWNPEHIDQDGDAPWTAYCTFLRSVCQSVDLVLLSHADLQHCGLYPYAFAHWNLRAPAYCTYPVQAMGRVAVLDEVESLRAEQSFAETDAANDPDAPAEGNDDDMVVVSREQRVKYVASKKDVHDAFDSLITMRYSQPTHLQGKCQGLTITPFSAAHTLGGAIWKIRSPSVGTIVYAVDMNHMRERHLDGTVLFRSTVLEALARPDVLITDADKTLIINSRRKDRDAALLELVTDTLNTRGGSLMIPCDSSTRVLELLVLFDQHWNFSKDVKRAPICLVSRTGVEMLTFVRSMMEWLGGTISKEDVGEKMDNAKGGNRKRKRDDEDEDAIGAFALRFRHLEFFTSYAQLLSTYPSSKPKLILAVPQNLSHGSSRAIFTDFAAVQGNVVVLTSRGEAGTLARHLFDKWNNAQAPGEKYGSGGAGAPITLDETMKLTMHSKVPLVGAELEAYQAAERVAQERKAKEAAALARSQMELEADDDDSESSDSDSDDDREPGASGNADAELKDAWNFVDREQDANQSQSFDIFLKGAPGTGGRATSFFKVTEGQAQRFKMFPYAERRRRVDGFGEVVDVALWLRKGKALEEGAESEEAKEAKRRKLAEDEAKVTPAEPPSKFITTEIEAQLSCRLFFVDMEGLNDSRAVKTIVPQVNPRKMILVHSTTPATEALIESCASIRAMTRDIYTPFLGDSVQIGQHINSFSLSLSEELLASIQMSRFEDTEVGYVVGRLVAHASSSIPVLEPVMRGVAKVEDEDAQRSRLRVAELPHSTMIGDLKLTALKARLNAINIPAEFAGEGVLVCGDFVRDPDADPNAVVAVRKLGRGKVEVEGGVCDVYYTVRREVYALHAIVATT
ncbi:hypothetical protein EXIGLDRAFT_600182 [Exidia glandulosa HHB12029]|uniref:Cleavage and polyadenylation specificity factor subunit 2 n=1 Tax=Exidia glandulosa HHB12029 TaxID=1314781 RepID=A0A165QJU2_EXIGL|nr:hypothetical protein EXIGLDRAFT_600182 [Exidia glandulosa HHB12029]